MTTPSNDGGEKFFQLGTKALIVQNNKVLLLKTDPAYSDGHIFWDFPGGRMKKQSGTTQADIEANLKREVEEETGIDSLAVGPFIHAAVMPHDVQFRVGLYGLVILIYKCTTRERTGITLSGEHTEYKWFGKNELPSDLQPWYREAIAKL